MRLNTPLRIIAPAVVFLTIATIAPIAAAIATAADTWPQFRGPDGNGVADTLAEPPPVEWSPERNVRWRTELEGAGWSSPVVAHGRVFVTAAIPRESSDGDHSLVLFALDAETGEIQWKTEAFPQRAEDSPPIHTKNSHASPTPIVTDDRVLVHFGHQGTAAIDLEGRVIWTNRQLKYPPVHGNGGSPILVDGNLIFTCDGAEDPFVAALSAEDGRVAWRVERPVDAESKFSFCTPTAITVDGQTQVIAPGSDCVMALDPHSGETIWMVRYDGYSVVPKPVYADGMVFVATGFGPTQVLAIEPTHRGDATDTAVAWSLDRGAPKTPSPLAHEGLLYVLSDDGILTVVQTADGQQVYRQRLGGAYSASPVLAAGKLYLTSEDGKTTVITAGRQFDVVAENDLGERTLASPAVVDGALFIRTADALYRISPTQT